MLPKRALIVDDSKSARFVLKRMLNDLNLEVDTVESAIDAIEYLKYHQPNVIFMDHMMPGMDGFEAVKRIKNNTQTSVIPIIMYTTKGGDVYLSQARALGAVAIIPKTISPVDLKESLLNLGLIDDVDIQSSLKLDRPVESKTSEKPIEGNDTKKQNVLDDYVNDLHKLMDDQTIELHRSMWLGIESVSNEIFNRLNSELEEKFDQIQPESQEITSEQLLIDGNKTSWPIYIVSSLLVVSVIFNVILLTNNNQVENKLVTVDENQIIISEEIQNIAESLPENQKEKTEFIKWAQNKVFEYPYNELALNDNRVPGIEDLVNKAQEVGFTGSIILQTHAGKFCLSSDQNGDYVLADEDMPITDCEYLGNFTQPNDEPTTHQSLGFANFLSDISSLNEKGIAIEVTNVTRKLELSKYPEKISQTKVKEWNNAAQLNNRITVKLEPALAD